MERTLDSLFSIYQAFGLQINTRKTEIVVQLSGPTLNIPSFNINRAELQNAPFFKYLGSIGSSNTKLNNDIIDKINKASRSLGTLRSKVFNYNHLKLTTKIQVYEEVCISTLLYGAEVWTLYRRHQVQLEQFQISCLKKSYDSHGGIESLTHRSSNARRV